MYSTVPKIQQYLKYYSNLYTRKKTLLTNESIQIKQGLSERNQKKELQSEPIKSKRKELNINSKISELENGGKKQKQMHNIRKAKQDIATDRKEIKTS